MAERLSDKLREFLATCEGRDVSLKYLREELKIDPNTPAWNSIREYLRQLVEKKIVRSSGRNDGVYRVVKRADPINVFGEPISEPYQLIFPRCFETMMEMDFADDLVIREGDLILISGQSNFFKTGLCLNFAGENIDSEPVLMGNEYTTLDNKPTPRFMNRIKNIDWIHWQDENGKQKFILLPVRSDYAEHIIKDKINIIDWINIDTGEHYMIGTIMESIKKELGKGIGIIAIQKSKGAEAGRGGQFTKDFADVEILLDNLPESDDVLLTIGKVKEAKKKVMGRTFAFNVFQGVKIMDFREIVKCKECFGKGWKFQKPCENCGKSGYTNK